MKFRKDINGLRAFAVIAVVLFHFDPSWAPGGFAGVDVFFVISGFLMTGIIFRGIENNNFSILKFYIARANRIIPALAVVCLALILFGWFFISPFDYKTLGQHIFSSLGFVSNFVYWSESGYFDVSSHEKWLLHTWSLAIEWQFYIIYPAILIALKTYMPTQRIKKIIIAGTCLSFIYCIIATYNWPNQAYYLLPSRVWQMLIGGIAYLYPLTIKNFQYKKILEIIGLLFIVSSYFLTSNDTPWPGYSSLLPVMGTLLVLYAHQTNSILTGNIIMQKLGSWSYSIYLWHWPIVVTIYYYSLNKIYIYLGISVSILLGFLSRTYIEKIKFKNNFKHLTAYLTCKPVLMSVIGGAIGFVIFINDGFINFTSPKYKYLIENSKPSPYRDKCHINKYQIPNKACEYFNQNISWAVLGDSHTPEISYALAEKLKKQNTGLKHFSFSSCKSSFQSDESFSKCAKWFNDAVDYIISQPNIQNIVLNHRYTRQMFGGSAISYPKLQKTHKFDNSKKITQNIDSLITHLSKYKKNIYIFYPIPELPKNIQTLIDQNYRKQGLLENISGTSVSWYRARNKYIISHFNKSKYPKNVHFIKPQEAFCDELKCYAVKNGLPLYFDDNHPSVIGAAKLVELLPD